MDTKWFFKKSNKLEFVSGPNWLIKKVFDKDTDEEESGGWWNINDIDLLELRKQNLKEYASNSNLICGIYGSGHFFLDLQTNKNYTYYFNRIPLLKGTWEKNGSELHLYAPTIPYTFSMLITQEGLISQLLPGDFKGLLFKKID